VATTWRHVIVEQFDADADADAGGEGEGGAEADAEAFGYRYILSSNILFSSERPGTHAACTFSTRNQLDAAKNNMALLIGHTPNVDFSCPPDPSLMIGCPTWMATIEVQEE
jgi:hypothetical protein